MSKQNGFRVAKLFHPTAIVVDLTQIGDFYEKVFGARPTSFPYEPQWHMYRGFMLLADAYIEHVSPEQRHFSPFRLFSNMIGGHWVFPCFYVEDMQDLIYRFHHNHGIRMTALGTGEPVTGLPVGPGEGAVPGARSMVWTHPWDTGISWEFWEGEVKGGDPRILPGWTLQPPSDEDNVGLEFTSHHTIVVREAEQTVRFLTEICGGTIRAEEVSDATGSKNTWVALGDDVTVLEIAEPRQPGIRESDLLRAGNTYHSLNFKVRDLKRLAAHLKSVDVKLEIDTPEILVTDPGGCGGLRFGFVERLHTFDPRLR